jgi:hypothetical protein
MELSITVGSIVCNARTLSIRVDVAFELGHCVNPRKDYLVAHDLLMQHGAQLLLTEMFASSGALA